MQGAQFSRHHMPKFGVERAERFIHQERLGFAHDGAPERHPLAIARGQTGHRAVQRCSICKVRATCATRARRSERPTPCVFRGKAMFCLTFMWG